MRFVEVSVDDVNDSKRCKLLRISLRYTSTSDFGTVLGKRKNATRRRSYQYLHARSVWERHAQKQDGRLQSHIAFRGFRANVSPRARERERERYIYIYTYVCTYRDTDTDIDIDKDIDIDMDIDIEIDIDIDTCMCADVMGSMKIIISNDDM